MISIIPVRRVFRSLKRRCYPHQRIIDKDWTVHAVKFDKAEINNALTLLAFTLSGGVRWETYGSI